MSADKSQPPERPAPKPPIYPVWVIEVACQALTAMKDYGETMEMNEARSLAFRIIRDGLASHERAIKGEP